MAKWNYKQNFNDLNDGDLASQDGWKDHYGNANVVVGNYSPYEGAKCVRMADDAGYTYYKRAIGPFEEGIVYAAIKKTTTDNSSEIFIGSVDIDISWNGKIYAWDSPGSAWEEIGSWSTDTWHKIGVKFDCSQNQFWVNIDNGDWVGPYGMEGSAPADDMDIIWIGTGKNSGNYVYYDDIGYVSLYAEKHSRRGNIYQEKFSIQSTSHSDKHSARTTKYSEKHLKQDTSHSDKYSARDTKY